MRPYRFKPKIFIFCETKNPLQNLIVSTMFLQVVAFCSMLLFASSSNRDIVERVTSILKYGSESETQPEFALGIAILKGDIIEYLPIFPLINSQKTL
jgi:hypothetical protein